MNSISSIRHLYAYEDGDTITPAMGVMIDVGYGLQQYFNPTTGKVVSTDFTKHPATLYPQAYSSRQAKVIVPETAGQQWYYNNISSEGAILEDGKVKSKFAAMFELTTVSANGQTFPALKIKGNLASASDYTDKYIYYSSTTGGKAFVCSQLIPIQASVGETCKVLVSVEGESGTGDNVLSNDNDWIRFTANLQLSGENITSGVTYAFQRLEAGQWKAMANVSKINEITANTLTVYNAGVEGVELFRCEATYKGVKYYEVFQATDEHDPFIIRDGCSNQSDAVKVGETVTFDPKVYDRSTDELQTGWTFSYSLTTRKDGTLITDVTEKTLTYANIQRYGGISVRILASKN